MLRDKQQGLHHTGGSNDQCAHKQDNPWMNQNPQPNSYYITDKGHVIIYGEDGKRVMDISEERIKIEQYNVNPRDPSKGSWSSWKLKDSSGLVEKTEQWILDYFGI